MSKGKLVLTRRVNEAIVTGNGYRIVVEAIKNPTVNFLITNNIQNDLVPRHIEAYRSSDIILGDSLRFMILGIRQRYKEVVILFMMDKEIKILREEIVDRENNCLQVKNKAL